MDRDVVITLAPPIWADIPVATGEAASEVAASVADLADLAVVVASAAVVLVDVFNNLLIQHDFVGTR